MHKSLVFWSLTLHLMYQWIQKEQSIHFINPVFHTEYCICTLIWPKRNISIDVFFSVFPGLSSFSNMFGKKKKRLEISAPSNFEHRVHTGFDPREQKFTGLPQQWQSLLADTANRPKPMVDPSYITPIQLAPMKVHNSSSALWVSVVFLCFVLISCMCFIITLFWQEASFWVRDAFEQKQQWDLKNN